MRYLVLFLAFSLSVSAAKIEFRDLSFKEGLAAAEEEGKPVFIDCFTDWCGPCKWMSANIFTDEAVSEYFNENYVCLKIDMEKGEGVEIAENYGIRAYPTLLFLDAAGERLLIKVGASRDPQSYIDAGEQAQDPERNLPYLLANKEANFNNPAFMREYFQTASSANMLDMADVDRYFENMEISEWAKNENWEIISNTVDDPRSEVFKKALAKTELFIKEQGKEAQMYFETTVYYALANGLYRARTGEQYQAYRELREELLSTNFPGSGKVALHLDLMENEMNENWEKYMAVAADGIEKHYWDDARALNSVSWTIYEKVDNPNALAQAERWAARAVELEPEHTIIDTQAHLLYKLGKKEEALKLEKLALKKAEEAGDDTEDYQAFIDEMMED